MEKNQVRDVKSFLGLKEIDFVGKTRLFVGVSVIAVLASFVLLFTKGLNYGIDFSGGTEVQVKFSSAIDAAVLRTAVTEAGVADASIQSFSGGDEYLVRFQNNEKLSAEQTQKIVDGVTQNITAKFAAQGAEIRRIDSVGPAVGNQLKNNSLLALFYSLLIILIYVGLRFDYEFAPGAVICLFHDVIITVGVFSLLEKEISIQVLAALLSIIGYSLNDTIIIYDRIRENSVHMKNLPKTEMINKSINDTLSRTILTTLTLIMAIVCIYVFGGEVMSDFALAMGIGMVVGTYSTVYVAAPLTLLFNKWFK